MPNRNCIGYIINESGVSVSDVEIRDYKGNPDRVTGVGCLQTGNEKNRNGRIYRTEDLLREINAPRQRELLAAREFKGECNHPLSKELTRQQTIDSSNACVRFNKLWMEGDNVMATFQGTNNAVGEMFDKDLRIGVKPAFSLRALGTLMSTPQGAVVENLKMITYDYVVYPSHPGAYTKGILNESSGLILNAPTSHFAVNEANDASKSFICEFHNNDVLDAIKKLNESGAIDYIKDKSANYRMLKECFDMTKFDTIDILDSKRVALTEAGNATIVMSIDDYISRELQNYIR